MSTVNPPAPRGKGLRPLHETGSSRRGRDPQDKTARLTEELGSSQGRQTDRVGEEIGPTEVLDGDEAHQGLATESMSAPQPGVPDVLSEAGETEEVYVILPEGEEGGIPVVETEVVDEESEGGLTETLVAPETVGAAGRAGFAMEEDDGVLQLSGAAYDGNLDQITSDLDDDLLAGPPVVEEADLTPDASGEWGEAEGTEETETGNSSTFRKLFAVAAVLAIVGVGGYFYLYPQLLQSVPVQYAAVSPTTTPPVDAGPVVQPGPVDAAAGAGTEDPNLAGTGGEPSPTPVGSGPTVDTRDPAQVARDAFHEKYLLALELGFAREVGNE